MQMRLIALRTIVITMPRTCNGILTLLHTSNINQRVMENDNMYCVICNILDYEHERKLALLKTDSCVLWVKNKNGFKWCNVSSKVKYPEACKVIQSGLPLIWNKEKNSKEAHAFPLQSTEYRRCTIYARTSCFARWRVYCTQEVVH